MPSYRRAFIPGGTFAFTLVTAHRRPIFREERSRCLLREVVSTVRAAYPFEIEAMVLLPDHLHCIWRLPADDADFAKRWRWIKGAFSKRWQGVDAPVSSGYRRKRYRGVWQPRYWEHMIRDEEDFERAVEYIHYNPVKHSYVECPHAWPWSSFHRFVAAGLYDREWGCACSGREPKVDIVETKAYHE